MRHEPGVQRIHLQMAALEPLAEAWPTRAPSECPFLERLGLAVLRLHASLTEALVARRTQAQLAALDDRMLKDIGLTRAEASGWGPLGDRVESCRDVHRHR